jgi:hypothetical protein
MKDCNGCKYANWKRTVAGRLHPSKAGRCMFQWKPVVVPLAYKYVSRNPRLPKPNGAYIWRDHTFDRHCPTAAPGIYQPEQPPQEQQT